MAFVRRIGPPHRVKVPSLAADGRAGLSVCSNLRFNALRFGLDKAGGNLRFFYRRSHWQKRLLGPVRKARALLAG